MAASINSARKRTGSRVRQLVSGFDRSWQGLDMTAGLDIEAKISQEV